MNESWLPVPEWVGYYEVSDQGRVRSLSRSVTEPSGRTQHHVGRVLRPGTGDQGYSVVVLCGDGVKKSQAVHVLVLTAFVGPRPSGLVTRHGNGVKSDNRAVNLRWGTRTENAYDAVRHGQHPMSKRTTCPRGHPYTHRNAKQRFCRTCIRARARRANHKETV
jgi:hypothetical protein